MELEILVKILQAFESRILVRDLVTDRPRKDDL
jgi:hypothetical protein